MRKVFLQYFICFTLFSCNHIQEETDVVYRIVIANASSCWPSPFEAMSIDTSLTLQYQGVAFVENYGCYNGKISSTTWQILRDSCASLLDVKSDTCWNAQDARIIDIIIYSSKGVQTFYGEYSCLPEEIVAYYAWLWRIRDNTALKKTEEFTLETGAHKQYDGFPRDSQSPYNPTEADTTLGFSTPEL